MKKTKSDQGSNIKLIVIVTWIIAFVLYAFVMMDNSFVMTLALALIFGLFSFGTAVLK